MSEMSLSDSNASVAAVLTDLSYLLIIIPAGFEKSEALLYLLEFQL